MRKALLLLAALAGCDDSVQIQKQSEYDFSLRADRDKWRAEDLAYQGSAGPYAIYQVTGANPRLVGPYVKAHHGFSTLGLGAKYFTADHKAKSTTFLMYGGRDGELALVAADTPAAPLGTCAASLEMVMDLPCDDNSTGGTSGGTGGSTGGTPGGDTAGTTGGNPVGDTGGTTGGVGVDLTSGGATGSTTSGGGSGQVEGATPTNDGNVGDVHHMVVMMKQVPAPGSLVLLRRAAISSERIHDAAIPNVCCRDGQCEVQ